MHKKIVWVQFRFEGGNMKKVAVIHDLSGIGRCSLNVAISILAVLKLQPCPMPTAILSNQTGFKSFSFLDFTPYIKGYYAHWKELGYTFDTIYSGFLGSTEQMVLVADFIKQFKTEKTLVVIDPVMGDHGELYAIYPKDYPEYMKTLIGYADVITPNMTEFTLLTGYNPLEEGVSKGKFLEHGERLAHLGPHQIIVTGVIDQNRPGYLFNIGMDFKRGEYFEVEAQYNGRAYSGTGDIFASIICGYLTHGYGLKQSIEIATKFIAKAIHYTTEFAHDLGQAMDPNEGVMYEVFLRELDIS